MWHPTLCVLVVAICSDLVKDVATLNPTDEGVCKSSIQIRSPRTRLRFYTGYVNKWCGKKKCVVRKSKKEGYFVTIKNLTLVCCNGWEYHSAEDRCTPSCTIGCSGGRCTAPDVCECDPPSHLNPQKNSCITPTCDKTCVNAVCQDDTCKCHLNFSPYNSTHCVPQCEDGYLNDPATLSCTPYCDICYGVCTAPNVCECPEGYSSNAGTCKPICDPACENAACVGIQSCVCHEGYIPGVNSWTCVPKCDACENGDCVGPNHCVCRDGFVMNHGVCSPYCSGGCVNSVCTAPGHCSCREGYVKEADESGCYKPCEGCNGTCVEGECVPVSCRLTGEMMWYILVIEYRNKTGNKTCHGDVDTLKNL